MNTDDLILVSIDDHVVEPPDMFLRHVPAKYKDEAPIVVTDDNGVDQWVYKGKPQGVSGLNAVVSWPPEEWGRNPAGFAEMRPGVYDVHQRVKDMSRNGILASMCFPTFTGFSARHLNQFQDPTTLIMVSAYNDWHIDEWAGSYPDRFIPIAVLPTWNPEAMCDEIRRVAAKGCHAVTMPELPHLEGIPSYHDEDYWGPVFRTLSEENVVMCLHIGTGFGAISMAPNAPIDNLIILATQISAMCAQDLLWGPAMRNYPDLKFAFSEGGIGWIPFYLDRSDRHYTNQKWLRRDFGDKLPSDVFREHSLACYVTDQDLAEAAPRDRHRHHRVGMRLPAFGLLLARCRRAGATPNCWRPAPTTPISTRSPGRTPAGSSGGIRSPAPRVKTPRWAHYGPPPPMSTSRFARARSGRGSTPRSSSPRPSRTSAQN